MAVRERSPKNRGVERSKSKIPSAKGTGSKGKTMSRTNGKGTHAHWPQAMSANAAVVAEAVDRSKKSARTMALNAADPTRSEPLSAFNPADVMNTWMALPSAWLGAAQSFGRLASPDMARDAMTSIADRQLQLWQMLLRTLPVTTLLQEQAKVAEAMMKAWQPVAGEMKSRPGKATKPGKAA